uniref:Tyrosine-protein phosphatase non-receptor type 4 n=1 Tax=Schistocephalus solidus TaxID=70667 RepID=A0A0X3P4B6_SCHSO
MDRRNLFLEDSFSDVSSISGRNTAPTDMSSSPEYVERRLADAVSHASSPMFSEALQFWAGLDRKTAVTLDRQVSVGIGRKISDCPALPNFRHYDLKSNERNRLNGCSSTSYRRCTSSFGHCSDIDLINQADETLICSRNGKPPPMSGWGRKAPKITPAQSVGPSDGRTSAFSDGTAEPSTAGADDSSDVDVQSTMQEVISRTNSRCSSRAQTPSSVSSTLSDVFMSPRRKYSTANRPEVIYVNLNTPTNSPEKNGTEFSEQERKISVASTVSSFDITNNDLEDGLVRVQIQPNSKGQFGFNFKGGADHGTPVLVSRVSSEMPAGMCIPRLNEGDQILFINGRDISKHTHDQVVNFIRAATEAHSGVLELLVQPRVYLAETIADKFGGRQIPDTGDAPPLPPKCLPEFKCSPSPPSPSWMPKSAQGFRPRPTNKPRLNGSVTARASRSGTRKPDITNTERLYQSIQELERGIEDGTIVMEFDRLERRLPTATTVDAKTHSNLSKNRYRDISPYDQTRVRIQGFSGDYINASFVKMELPKSDETNEYIAAQGPLPNTCIDFWQMCWEQNTHIIVMLTSVTEHGRDKCHKYWPALNKSFEFSWTYSKALPGYPKNPGRRYQMRIATLREEENNDFAYREFQLSRGFSNTSSRSGDMTSPQLDQVTSPRVLNGTPVENGFEARRLIQLQFINWPDHGVPDDPAHLITFVEKFRSLRGDRKVAAVVHCSAGIGRTGVVILLDTAIDLIKAGHAVFPLELVRQMRYYREMLIQTSAQFKFACESIVKYYYDFVRKRLPSSTR